MLCRFVVLSSLVVSFASAARSHEVTPTIGNLTVQGGRVELDLRLNIEAFLAGIDLDGLIDTNTSAKSERYDELRSMNQSQLKPLVDDFSGKWLKTIGLNAPDRIDLSLESFQIPEVGDPELTRASHLLLTAQISDQAQFLTIEWPDGAGDLVLRQNDVEQPFTGLVRGGEKTPRISIAGGSGQSGFQVFASYIAVGFDHILPKGLDHILFVLGLFFLSTHLRPLVWQVSAFTLAHTVTLAMGALGWVQIKPEIVEPLIAASIVYVAVENILSDRLSRWRPAVIFGFGLLHGLGFASVLGEFGLPQGQFISALLGFNVGVEIGQLTVIAIAFLSVGMWFRNKVWYRSRIAVPASVAIGLVGMYWFVERII